MVSENLSQIIAELTGTIRQIRATIFALRDPTSLHLATSMLDRSSTS